MSKDKDELFALQFLGEEDVEENKNTFENSYEKLFSAETEVDETYARIQKERKRRVEQAASAVGADVKDIEKEMGFVAPMPVTADEAQVKTDDLVSDEYQKAMIETAKFNTMQIKLNVTTDTIELERNSILENLDENLISSENEQKSAFDFNEDIHSSSKNVEPEQLNETNRYRKRNVPVHLIDIDVLEDAIQKTSSETKFFTKIVSDSTKVYKKQKKVEETEYTPNEKLAKYISNLSSQIKVFSFKSMIGALLSIAIVIFTLINQSLFLVEGAGSPTIFILINLVFLGAVYFFNYQSIAKGIKALFNSKPNTESALSLASIAVTIQCLLSFVDTSYISARNIHIYTSIVIVAWGLNALGNLTNAKRIHSNFKFFNSKEQKYSVGVYRNKQFTVDILNDCKINTNNVAYQRKEDFPNKFLEISNSIDEERNMSFKNVYITTIVSLVFAIIAMFIKQDAVIAFSVLTASLCISVPLTNVFASSFHLNKLSKAIRRTGSMITGEKSFAFASNIDTLLIADSDIFPEGTVVIKDAKLSDDESFPEYAPYISTVLEKIGGGLSSLADIICDEREDFSVENLIVEPQEGISAAVSGKKILIGTIDLMKKHKVKDYDKAVFQTISLSNNPLYLSVEDKVVAVLSLDYRIDKRKLNELKKIKKLGIRLLVHNVDPNINTALISKVCGIEENIIAMLPSNQYDLYASLINDKKEALDANIITKGRLESFVRAVSLCKGSSTMAITLMNELLTIVLGLVLVAIFVFAVDGMALSMISMLGFMLISAVLSLVFPKFIKK